MKSREYSILFTGGQLKPGAAACWYAPALSEAEPEPRPICCNNEPLFYPRRMVSRSLITCDSLIRKSVSTFRFQRRRAQTEVQPEKAQAEQEAQNAVHDPATARPGEEV